MIDSHIHLDHYEKEKIETMMGELPRAGVEAVIAVSTNLASCQRNCQLVKQYPDQVRPAYGYHPEQQVPTATELRELLHWIRKHQDSMIAVGEVGLPYYKRKEAEAQGEPFSLAPYIDLLETFILLAKELEKPIVLHAVYEDADLVCDLLTKHEFHHAHFHWFKGSQQTVERMIDNGYFISITPDIVYEPEIQQLAKKYPLNQLMVETDGPWPFEGPFQGKMTHPAMISSVISKIAEIKGIEKEEAKRIVTENTRKFYRI